MSDFKALYIHVPFCRRKCDYCSFVSFSGRETEIGSYTDALCGELRERLEGQRLTTIFFGGGTPSLLTLSNMTSILETISRHADISPDAEISLEANPGTIDTRYLSGLRYLGVNRLSLGVQSFNDRELALLGRIHSVGQALQAIDDAREAGFDNLNIDLMYGLPGQNSTDWRRNLEKAIDIKPEHISLYALTLEPDCPMALSIEQGKSPDPDGDLAADMYELTEDILAEAGYRHYEISNWARPGLECRHNLVYWHNQPYLGAGVAAHSLLDGHRLAHTPSLDEYVSAWTAGQVLPPAMDETITPELRLAESVILGLRLDEGVDIAAIDNEFETSLLELYRQPVEDMTEAGLLEQSNGRLKLTQRGRLLSNEVFWRLLPEKAAAATV